MSTKLEMIQQTEVGNYTYHGATMNLRYALTFETFSVGIFQVIPKSSGKGKKAANVIFRLKGVVGYEDWVNRCATYICDGLNAAGQMTPQSARKRARVLRDLFTVNERIPW